MHLYHKNYFGTQICLIKVVSTVTKLRISFIISNDKADQYYWRDRVTELIRVIGEIVDRSLESHQIN